MSRAARINLEHYEQSAPGQDDYWRLMAAPRFRMETLLSLVAAGGWSSLVDLGCGAGLLLREIGARFPAVKLAGVDLSQRLIERNRQEHPRIEWHTLDLDRPVQLPHALRKRFAAVVAMEVIEHLDDPLLLLANAAALGEPGATLLLSTQSGPLRETERRVGHVRHFSRDEMAGLLCRVGWKPVSVWNAGFPFHDLSKWVANLRPDASMERFGNRPYGALERSLCRALRVAFRFNSGRRGAQLFAIARLGVAPDE
jgi:2-polyprenyl-3-methyl-5-hydroxy-6-metoxy-1,4-benzoquinol methylase